MRLRHSPTSPFVRKVNVVALETGLAARLEAVLTDPWEAGTDLVEGNPLGKVPALHLDDGEVLYDSRVICEYLDSLHDGPPLFPAPGPSRWRALRWQALGDGLMDAAVLGFVEVGRRPAQYCWAAWVERQGGVMRRALARFEAEIAGRPETLDIGQISLGCALGYLDLRHAAFDWRSACPALAAWFEAFDARASMQATRPPRVA